MNEKQLEQQFEKALAARCAAADLQFGGNSTRFLHSVERLGGVGAIKALVRKGDVSDGFDLLEKAGQLALSVEALVTEAKYASLFSDEEVDHCLAMLCDAGYYQNR